DSFSDYYERGRKEQNLETLRRDGRFTLEELDLVAADPSKPLRGPKVVFHLAGQPGVRPGWGGHFDGCVQANISATQRLLEAFVRFMDALVEGHEIEIYGDGEQTREFTFVSDAVDGTVKAASADVVGQIVNLGGGSRVTINRVLATLEDISRLEAHRKFLPAA